MDLFWQSNALFLNMLSRLVITFLPRSKRLLISWLQSPSAVILESPKIKSVTVPTVSPSICHKVIVENYRQCGGICEITGEGDQGRFITSR